MVHIKAQNQNYHRLGKKDKKFPFFMQPNTLTSSDEISLNLIYFFNFCDVLFLGNEQTRKKPDIYCYKPLNCYLEKKNMGYEQVYFGWDKASSASVSITLKATFCYNGNID